MFQVRLHGRGGQGVVTAAELLSVAAFAEDQEAQAFPSFGSERMGAPVMAFCRIDDKPIRLREPVSAPDGLIIQDPTLVNAGAESDVFAGLASDGFVLINTTKSPEELGLEALLEKLPDGHLRTAPGSEIARKHLGRPLPNAALLGAFAALTGILRLESLQKAIREKFPGKVGQMNAAAAQEAYESIAGAAV
jgi:pyruvate ferredoxin oxidoreductase gamma subunit